MVPNKRFWRILALLVASVLLPIFAMLIIDYRKTIGLRSRVDSLAIGTPENELLAALGAPDAVSQGSLMFERNVTVHGYTVWTYCSPSIGMESALDGMTRHSLHTGFRD